MKNIATITASILFVTVALFSEASAQIADVTFSRPVTGDLGESEIRFRFGFDDDVEVEIDQLGMDTALFQNNDTFGQEVIAATGLVTSIGEVTIGQVLAAGTDFGSTSLNLSDFIAPGENFFLGFSNGTDVGYFNIAWEAGANSDIVYSTGEFATGGSSLTVAAVPEPGTITLVSVLAMSLLVRRRRV